MSGACGGSGALASAPFGSATTRRTLTATHQTRSSMKKPRRHGVSSLLSLSCLSSGGRTRSPDAGDRRRVIPGAVSSRGASVGVSRRSIMLLRHLPGVVETRDTRVHASADDGDASGQGGGAAAAANTTTDATWSRAKLNKLKVGELRQELEERGASTDGKKPDLVERLYDVLQGHSASSARSDDDDDNGGEDDNREHVDHEKETNEMEMEMEMETEMEKERPLGRGRGQVQGRGRDRSTSSSTTSTSNSNSSSGGGASNGNGNGNGNGRGSSSFQRTLFNSRPAERVSGGSEIGEDGETNFSGMEVTFLGTSSGSPSFTRNVSSYALRLTDEIWLFDCGEATQHQLMRSHLKYTKITRIFITHMHGDHIFGLPGLICALSGSRAELRRVHGREPDPLYITGPPGICDYIRAAMTCSRTALGLPLVVTELTAPGNGMKGAGAGKDADPRGAAQQMHMAADGRCRMFLGERWPDNGAAAAPGFQQRDMWSAAWDGQVELPYWTVHREPAQKNNRGGQEGGIVVRAAPLRHPVPCFGYVIDEPDQAGRMDVEKATALGLPPGKEYKYLKEGQSVQTKVRREKENWH